MRVIVWGAARGSALLPDAPVCENRNNLMRIGTIFSKIDSAIAELGASKLDVLLENRSILPDLHPAPLLRTVSSDPGNL